MTRCRLLLLAALAMTGCYKPGYEDCAITCASGACPSGLSCVAGMCREPGATGACGSMGDGGPDSSTDAPIDAPPNSDPDQDSVITAQDNCPFVANRNQFNEDGDPLGDACDPCPPLPGAANMDGDGDNVGDGCDPNPTTAGDRMVLFEGFNDPTMIAPGVNMVGSWGFNNGSATYAAPQSVPFSLTWPINAAGSRVTVRTRGRIQTLQGNNQMVGAGTVDGTDASGNGGTVCILGYEGGGSTMQNLIVADPIPGGSVFVRMSASGALLQDQAWQQRRLTVTGGHGCIGMPAQPNELMSTQVFPNPNGGAGLWARGATGAFDWVMIVTSP